MGIFRIELGGVGMTGGADGSVPLAFKAPETTPGAAAIKLPVAKNFRRLKDCPLVFLVIVRSSKFTVGGVYANSREEWGRPQTSRLHWTVGRVDSIIAATFSEGERC